MMTKERQQVVEEEMSQALDAINDEALRLAMLDDLPEEVQDGLDLIILLSRHKHDVRTMREKQSGGDR